MTHVASAPAKAILVGEHAVVYGKPALAVPLSQLRTYIDFHSSASPLKVSFTNISRAPLQWERGKADSADPLATMIGLTAQYLRARSLHGEMTIRSDIPVASGLGSGAAVSAAIGRAVAGLLHRDIPDRDLNALVYEVEKLHHGTPSGIDNTVVVYERPVYFLPGKSIDFIDFADPIQLVVADTGVAALTLDTVADVRCLYQRQPRQTQALFDRIGTVVDSARSAIETGDHKWLGELMTQNHALLQALDVSSAALDRLVHAAVSGGALGAKLSGGGRGGNIIALVNDASIPSVKAKLLEAGAKGVFVTSSFGSNSKS